MCSFQMYMYCNFNVFHAKNLLSNLQNIALLFRTMYLKDATPHPLSNEDFINTADSYHSNPLLFTQHGYCYHDNGS